MGYDIWLGNNRGTKYSRGHTDYNLDREEDRKDYFDYSFFEMGKYDLPAQIDFVRKETGKQQVAYIGYS
jgi:pimeloyl-ACP methyl ester carboxylesterase